MRVLISGFEPGGGRDVNPTALLVEALNNHEIEIPEGLKVEQILLPVTFEKAFEVFKEKIDVFNPDMVISFGLAANRDHIELETLAVNRIHADIKDNAGAAPQNQLINPDGPESFLSTLPVQGLAGALQKEGLPVKLSSDTGNFVCNYLFYRLMETNQDTERLCGFIHVPMLEKLSYGDLLRAVSVILNYVKY